MIRAYFRHEHADNPMLVQTTYDADRLVDALLAEPFTNSVAALYAAGRRRLPSGLPDHEFLVAVDPANGCGGLRYMGDGGTFYSKGTPSSNDTVCYFYAGSDREFPRDCEVSIDVVRRATKEFLATGTRPTCVAWQSLTGSVGAGQ